LQDLSGSGETIFASLSDREHACTSPEWLTIFRRDNRVAVLPHPADGTGIAPPGRVTLTLRLCGGEIGIGEHQTPTNGYVNASALLDASQNGLK
jgi:hypothetical protein